MMILRELLESPEAVGGLDVPGVLVAAIGPSEVVIHKSGRKRDSTMVFLHETIPIMKTERAEALDKLRAQLGPDSLVLPIRQGPESLWEQITLGRSTTADLMVEDPAVSAVHANFAVDGNEDVTVEDVGSSNGTFVNRTPLQPHVPCQLRSGDCVRFGQTVFYFVSRSMLKEMVSP